MTDAKPIRVMTFNIRNSGAADGPDAWDLRADGWAAAVRRFDPDLLGVQEVLDDQHDFIREQLADYHIAGVPREDGVGRGERALVLCRRERFHRLDRGDLWLSPTPAVVGSRGWDAACARLCSWTVLRDRATGRQLLFANTHFDHEGVAARRESARLLRAELPSLAAGAAIVLVGDFNCTEADEPYSVLTADGKWIDSYRAVHPKLADDEASFHDFAGTTAGRRIDWVLHTPDLTATAAAIDRTPLPTGRFPSDHYPVTADLRWAGERPV
jgi:endonuclease/exonuclease/phosphatase family metal-dependent hydrolase